MLKKTIPHLAQFFKDDAGAFSMVRLVTFLVVITLCFDAFWTLIVLSQPWTFGLYKFLFALVAITGKISEKFVMNWNIPIGTNSVFQRRATPVGKTPYSHSNSNIQNIEDAI
jgi:hypothetical protein